jgi:hypothetical protein
MDARLSTTQHSLLLLVAIVLFAFATFVALADATFKFDAALVPGGLFFFAASFF